MRASRSAEARPAASRAAARAAAFGMASSAAGFAVLLFALCGTAASQTPRPPAQAPSAAGTSALDPAFRLAAGGRALAGPLVDSRVSPPAAWLLSEDRSLYALTDEGALAARIDLGSSRPEAFLALDPFGRAIAVLGSSSGKAELAAFTRMGSLAWRVPIELPAAGSSFFPPAFGSDGRAFAISGRNLICLSPSGILLWSRPLSAAASCPPGADARGYPCVGLADGTFIIATPYGEEESRSSLGSAALALCALPAPASAAPAQAVPLGTAFGATATAETSPAGTVPAGSAARPLLAAGMADGRVLLVGRGGAAIGEYRSKAKTTVLVWSGSVLYGLDASGEAFALPIPAEAPGAALRDATGPHGPAAAGTTPSASPSATASAAPVPVPALWSTPTLCARGSLQLFRERLVATGQGRAVSLSLAGEVFRELSVPGGVGLPAISPNGLAYASGSDWVLAAYRFERKLGEPVSIALEPYPSLPDIASRELLFDPMAADPDRQISRLTDIHNSLRSGTIGEKEPAAAAYCAAVIERSLERERGEEERRLGGSPLARVRACELLGELGSLAYREPLFAAAAEDPDPAVRASACQALAALQADPDGRSMSAFLAAASRPVDERTALVIVDAIEGMALRSGRAPVGDALRALVVLTSRPYGQAVRSRALAAIGRISGVSQ